MITISATGAFFSSSAGLGFFNPGNPLSGAVGNTLEAQFFILLHEFAHFFAAKGYNQHDGEKNLDATKARRDNNHRRLMGPIGNIPPAEAEQRYYASLESPALVA